MQASRKSFDRISLSSNVERCNIIDLNDENIRILMITNVITNK